MTDSLELLLGTDPNRRGKKKGIVLPPAPPPPSSSGGGFPDASNTGVPVGTVLTVHTGDLVVTQDSAVVDAVDVRGCIDVRGVGVLVKRSKAECVTNDWSARAKDPANGPMVIEDTEIDCRQAAGGGFAGTAILWQNYVARRVNIHGCENGLDMSHDAVLEDSYVHHLYQCPIAGCPEPGSPHTGAIQGSPGTRVTIRHNTLYAFTPPCTYPNPEGTCNGSGDISLNNLGGGGTTTDTLIQNNLLAGGAYTLRCPKNATVNYRVLDNHFSTLYSPKVGEFGPVDDCAGETWSRNLFHETGAAVPLG